MKKMHGRWLVRCALVVASYVFASPSLELEVVSLEGDPLAIIGAGQPFVVQVTCNDMQGNCSEPTIDGLEQLEIEHKRFAMHTINKQSTIVHSYTVRVDMPGSYIVGPARVEDDAGQIIESDAVTLSVGSSHEQKKKGGKNKRHVSKSKQPSYFLRVYPSAETAYVGERIPCTIRLYHDKAMTPQTVEQRSDVEKSGLVLSAEEVPPTYGEKEIDGKRYGYYQWKFEAMATKPGRLVLPAFNTVVPSPSSWPSSFFMMQSSQRIYSNAVAFKILPVNCDPPVDLVGRFTALTATVNPGAARQGSAMTLIVELEGDNNVANCDRFIVQNVPDGLRIYESAQRVQQGDDGRGYTKQFEFVLHGVKSGEWEIPAQSLCYFDLTQGCCKTITSPPVQVTVLPDRYAQEHTEPPNVPVHSAQEFQEVLRSKARLDYETRTRAYLPLWIVILLLLPLGAIPVTKTTKHLYAQYGIEYVHALRRRLAFVHARRHIRSAQRIGACERLYGIFITVFAIRMQVPESSITKEATVQILRSKGLDPALLQQWSEFFYELESASFKNTLDTSCYELCKQAMRWVGIIEKVL